MKLIPFFFLLFFAETSFGANSNAGYNESLYLCDLGIKNANSANQDGVDFIQYFQNSKTLSVNGGTTYSTALNAATSLDSNFNLWADNAIDNVSINLESDYYGSEYFLEYCYKWDRISPSDNNTYYATFLNSLSGNIPFTDVSSDIICSLEAKNKQVTNTAAINKLTTTNSLNSNFMSMRCTIKFNFKENSSSIKRPHYGEAETIDPKVTVKVSL